MRFVAGLLRAGSQWVEDPVDVDQQPGTHGDHALLPMRRTASGVPARLDRDDERIERLAVGHLWHVLDVDQPDHCPTHDRVSPA